MVWELHGLNLRNSPQGDSEAQQGCQKTPNSSSGLKCVLACRVAAWCGSCQSESCTFCCGWSHIYGATLSCTLPPHRAGMEADLHIRLAPYLSGSPMHDFQLLAIGQSVSSLAKLAWRCPHVLGISRLQACLAARRASLPSSRQDGRRRRAACRRQCRYPPAVPLNAATMTLQGERGFAQSGVWPSAQAELSRRAMTCLSVRISGRYVDNSSLTTKGV